VISRSAIVLESVLQLLRPAVRLMLRHGVTAPAFATALKRVFLQAAQDELRAHGKALTDSAVSLLSGVHRRDVRNLTRLAPPATARRRFYRTGVPGGQPLAQPAALPGRAASAPGHCAIG
jgi:hypothetical protein